MTTITKERLLTIKQWRETYGPGSNVVLPAEEAEELARIALASLEAKSRKLFTCSGCGAEGLDEPLESKCHCNEDGAHWVEGIVYTAQPAQVSVPEVVGWEDVPEEITEDDIALASAWAHGFNQCRAALLQGSQPVSNRDELPEEKGSSLQLRNLIRQRHAEWSEKTFGNVGPVGPLKHLSKEALEAAAEPDDLSEWADMQFLLWDAQRRAGISDGEITAAMEEKLKVNMARQWPEPKDGEPRQHIQNDWQSCNHLLPIGELLKRLNEQTGEEWVSTTDLDYGKWVKCSDRMPVKMVNVLVFDAGGNKFICCQENGFWRDFRVGSSRHEITHWMALPAAPQLEVK